tara:strand:- start:715 stop:879 length:165 start_codon:yes stop_codon:yes gene_type:complete
VQTEIENGAASFGRISTKEAVPSFHRKIWKKPFWAAHCRQIRLGSGANFLNPNT